MLFFGLASDADVVYVGTTEVKTTKNTVDNALESLRCIAKPKRHLEKFERGEWGSDSRFGMSSGATGTWWYARTRLIVKKTTLP